MLEGDALEQAIVIFEDPGQHMRPILKAQARQVELDQGAPLDTGTPEYNL